MNPELIINRLKKSKSFTVIGVIVNIIIAVYIAQYIVGHYLIAHGQEVNSTEEASKNAKEILCNKYYELEYCQATNSTKPTAKCFTKNEEVPLYLGNQKSRCILS